MTVTPESGFGLATKVLGAAVAAVALVFGWLIKRLWETKPDRAEVLAMIGRAQDAISASIKELRSEIILNLDKSLNDYRFNRDREGQLLIAAFNRQLDDQSKWLAAQIVSNRESTQERIADLARRVDELREAHKNAN